MKRLLICLFLFYLHELNAQQQFGVSFTPSTGVFTGSTNVNMTPDGYWVWLSTNATTPLSQWTLLTNIPATTIVAGSTNYVAVTNWVLTSPFPPPNFVAIQYTNSMGVSPFSNIAGSQSWSNSATALRIYKYP